MTCRLARKLALAGAVGALLTGCGSGGDEGDPIPAGIRDQLDSRLEETQRRLDANNVGACDDITNDTQPEVERLLATVPEGVDRDVRSALEDGFARLFELTSRRCDELRREQSETDTDTTETVPPPEPEPTTPEEETTPTEQTDTEQQPPEEEPPPPDGGEGEGKGKGQGEGNSGGGGGNGNGGVGGNLPLPGDDGGAVPPGEG